MNNLCKKYQRRIKLNLLKKNFPALELEYFPNRDVIEIKRNGKIFHAFYAYENLTKIIRSINDKLQRVNYEY